MSYPQELEKAAYTGTISPVSEDLLSRYKRQLSDNKKRGEDLQKLILLLEENPKTLEIMQLMGRI